MNANFIVSRPLLLDNPRAGNTNPMGDVVNLNKFRKRRLKLEKARQAETNRRVHGRTKEERARELLAKKQLEGKVDGARLTKAPHEDGSEDE